jgi:sarcosine oxidase subunit alpha
MQTNRLDNGGRIDRSRPLKFRFDGRPLEGFEGDTLASALLANGVSIVGRSFKLHRPRGIVTAGVDEPNAIMQIGSGARVEPNLRATEVPLSDGLIAESTRGWPSAGHDIAAIVGRLGPLLGAGFYYKTFKWPRRLWPVYETLIRAAAGFGSAPRQADPDRYDHRNSHCDVLVVGAGPAGLAAALAAAEAGARIIVADEQFEFGGSLLASTQRIGGSPAAEWLRSTVAALSGLDNVTMLPCSTAFGYHDHDFLTIAQRRDAGPDERAGHGARQRLWRVRARQVVLAQGALERPLVFCNNDRPGIMLASAVSTYIHRYAVCPGRRAIVFTNNDSAYRTALDLAACGADVVIVDSRATGAGAIAAAAAAAGITILAGHVVTDVAGARRVRGARVAAWDGNPETITDSRITIDCDLIATSGGWSPALHLHSQAGGRIVWDERLHCFVPAEPRQATQSAGAGNGKWALRQCLQDGAEAGAEAASRCGLQRARPAVPEVSDEDAAPMQALWRVPADRDPDRCPKQFVDLQNDVSVADIRLAVREGYRNVEHVKRYTALGFGTDQGKLGNINGMAVLAECLGEPLAEVGTTTFRPAYTPVTFGTIAGEAVGELYDPVRKTPIHEWHEASGAPMEIVGQWHRPHYFPRDGESMDAAVARECLAVRNSLGIMDASTLGKIDARGPDVVAFLERMYTHDVARMAVGRCAYGVLLGEDGMVMDDGVMARIDERQFYLTTTTGGAARVLAWLEFWLQTEWPDLEVHLTSLTDHYSTIAVAGPNSRKVLEKLGCSIALDAGSFPFMNVRAAELDGLPVQLFRVSFSGELAFEVNVDSRFALAMWQRLMEAGREFEMTPYGTESMHVLRAEKGYVIVGQDTDGSVTPVDLGLNWLLSENKDFIGKRSLSRPDCRRAGRKQLVGLLSPDGETVLPEGTQLVDDPGARTPVPMCGHVTSSYLSACLDHPIALALVEGGRSREGETIHAMRHGREPFPVTIARPVFYDREGRRQDV